MTPSKKLEAHGEFLNSFDDQTADGNVNKRWQKYSQRGNQRTGNASEQITDERRRSEYRSRRDLTDGNRIDQLFIGQPAEVEDEISAQISQQNITASV